jgi:hypothetical protein
MLIIEYVASTATGHSEQAALERKDKRALPIPVRVSHHRIIELSGLNKIGWLF